MQTTSKKLIILGCSDGIHKIKKDIPDLIELHDTLGLNNLSQYYKTNYMMWIDHKGYGNCVYKLENEEYKPYLKYTPNFLPENDLFGAYTCATFAISFAIKEGYDKVVLYGVLDGKYKLLENNHIEYYHFYNDIPFNMHIDNLKAWRDEISRYSNRIEIEIPNQTFF